MNGNTLVETSIQGHICTNSNKEFVAKWRGNVERSLGSLDLSFCSDQKISVELKFWISETFHLDGIKFLIRGGEEILTIVKEWN